MARIYKAPRGSTEPNLGRTLPSLLIEALEKNPCPKALNQRSGDGWRSFSTGEFLRLSEETALGLLEIGLARQDRIALFMHSDVYFCVADMACLIAGMIDVPIYLTHAPESIRFVMRHAQARALFVSNMELLEKLGPFLGELTRTKAIIVAQTEDFAEPPTHPDIPEDVEVRTLHQVRMLGRKLLEKDPEAAAQLREEIDHRDVATIIYTSGTTGKPKGVMLTHENISFNSLGAFHENTVVKKGEGRILSFLPLTHVFARMLQYGYMNYGSEVYFCEPEEVSRLLKEVKPSGFATVPHLLEKVYEKIVLTGAQLTGTKKRAFDWALRLAKKYDHNKLKGPLFLGQLKLADKLVFSKWRQALGGEVECVISGGAALRPELNNLYLAAGVTVVQGYGMTETSPVITYNRVEDNHPGTVGTPLPGVEVTLAEDGEILTRGPHVMRGYYRNPEGTREAVDEEGWMHTGDIGKVVKGRYLKVTDRKKSLFKLSTGKYVYPQPLEGRLTAQPLVDEAVVVGPDRKYVTALLVPDEEALRVFAKIKGLDKDAPVEELLAATPVVNRFDQIVREANDGMPSWVQIQYFRLITDEFSAENGLLTPTLKVRRPVVYERFAKVIDDMYRESPQEARKAS
ncbi:MAG TPA: long-chain fatty acid--CoA ligase [Acidobacteriota bacterium]|nr:long-chain fatty acid--CoA ligase [Acidobacteriota bacterium]